MLPARPILVRIVLAMVALALGGELVRAETKVALVVGNSNYTSADTLKNPANDAAVVKAALSSIGFNVVLKQDVTEQEFLNALRDFAREASKADIALFYFAGHGVQFQGQNYFLPVDTHLTDTNDIYFNSVAMDPVLAATSKAHKTKILVLDACRNTVSERSRAGSRSLPDIGVSGGWGKISNDIGGGGADGMIVFYSAEPGTEADDGAGAASPFAQAFSKWIVERNVKI